MLQRAESGQGLMEYALILVIVAVTVIIVPWIQVSSATK